MDPLTGSKSAPCLSSASSLPSGVSNLEKFKGPVHSVFCCACSRESRAGNCVVQRLGLGGGRWDGSGLNWHQLTADWFREMEKKKGREEGETKKGGDGKKKGKEGRREKR